jgi:superfamily I DNA/RNA helicase
MVCSLTRTAAAEVAGRDLPLSKDAIGTLHSHAYRALGRGKIEIADDPAHLSEWNEAHPNMALSAGRILDEDNSAPNFGPTEADAAYADYNNQRARLTERAAWQQSTLFFAKIWEHWKHEQLLLDFTDLLEVAFRDTDTAPSSPSVIFADEAQDFSALEMALLQKWGNAAGRLVIVGDPFQSLYEWRGADADVVFPPIGSRNGDYRILGQSYRVPQAVHTAAMCWIAKMPGFEPIEYLPTAEPGLVASCPATADRPSAAADVIERALSDGKTTMYLASTARMLRPMLAVLRIRGVPFHNQYRRAEGAWNPLQIRRTAKGGMAVTGAQRLAAFLRLGAEGVWTKDDVRRWATVVKGSEVFPGGRAWKYFESFFENLPDRDAIDMGLWEMLVGEAAVEASMSQDLDWWLEHLLASRRDAAAYPINIARARGREALLSEPTVTVGTIHSVKGGEADVVIIAPDVSVPGAAEWAASDAGKASIYRLFYVALTRAKQEVHVMQPVKPSMAVGLL